MNHKWKNNNCVNCGITRIKKGWKLLMAISDHPPYNHFKYGNSWFYGIPYKENQNVVKSIGFERPECKIIKSPQK